MSIRLVASATLGETAGDLALDEGRLVAVALPGPVDAAPALDRVGELHPDERAAARAMAPRRQRTFVGGRLALRRALARAGAASRPEDLAAIVADARGAPSLPEGFQGSIGHKDEIAVALARRDDGWTVGVDVETARPLALALTSRILRVDERATLPTDDDAGGRELLRRFAAKEAIYKAIDPHLRRWVGFLEVALGPADGGYVVTPPCRGGEPRLVVEARAFDAGDVVLAVARARRA